MRKAISYIRFSTPRQVLGDSIRRQLAATEDFCARHGLELDTSLSIADMGVSAFGGANVTNGALGAFVAAVREGRVAKGTTLVVESLDRLSRDHVRSALHLFLELGTMGIDIATTAPERIYPHDAIDPLTLIEPLLTFARAHEESATKSRRVKEAHGAKVAQARKGGGPVKTVVPAWCRVEGERIVLDPGAADAIRRIFALALEGKGTWAIAKVMNEEGVPAIARGETWVQGYIGLLLRDERVIGRYTPRRVEGRRRVPEGEPIDGYYPRVIDDATWYATRRVVMARGKSRGRRGRRANIFRGLLRDARDGSHMILQLRPSTLTGAYHVLIPTGGYTGSRGGPFVNYHVLERCVLAFLREVKVADIVGTVDGHDEVEALTIERRDVAARLERRAQELVETDSPTLVKAVQALEAKLATLDARLADAKMKAATPLSSSIEEAQTLADLLDTAKDRDGVAERIRAALQRSVESMWCLVTKDHASAKGGRSTRYGVVTIRFVTGVVRTILFTWRTPSVACHVRTPGWMFAAAWTSETAGAITGALTPEQVASWERMLPRVVRQCMETDEITRANGGTPTWSHRCEM